jgi:hypothetical protein
MKNRTNLALLLILMIVLAFACDEKQKTNTVVETIEDQTKQDSLLIDSSLAALNNYNNTIDKSPMDMVYFPVDYPKIKMANSSIAPPVTRVIYSRPHLAKRHLFHDLLKYEEPWRLGANESTEIDFYKVVTIQGKKVNPGRYILYCIPHPQTWTIVLNTNIDSWGLQQDPKKDVQRFEIPIKNDNPSQEYFTMQFEKSDTGANLKMSWDNVSAELPMEF